MGRIQACDSDGIGRAVRWHSQWLSANWWDYSYFVKPVGTLVLRVPKNLRSPGLGGPLAAQPAPALQPLDADHQAAGARWRARTHDRRNDPYIRAFSQARGRGRGAARRRGAASRSGPNRRSRRSSRSWRWSRLASSSYRSTPSWVSSSLTTSSTDSQPEVVLERAAHACRRRVELPTAHLGRRARRRWSSTRRERPASPRAC